MTVLMNLTLGMLSVLEEDIKKSTLEGLYSEVFVNNNPTLVNKQRDFLSKCNKATKKVKKVHVELYHK